MTESTITKQEAEVMEAALYRELGPLYMEIRKLTRTRRYFVPGGHCDPARLSLNLECMIFNCIASYGGNVRRLDVVDRYAFYVAACLMQAKLPCYFVDQGILDAVLRTEPPENMLFEDLHWPMETAAFMPPIGAIQTPSGEYVTNLSYAFMPSKRLVRVPGMPALDVSTEVENMSHCLAVLANTSKGETYAQYIPLNLTMGLGEFLQFAETAPFNYTDTVQEHNKLGIVDADYNRYLLNLTLRLVMVMAARPNLIELGERKKPARVRKDGKPEAELWTPNWVGYKYKAAHVKGTGQGGHKAIHWRVGHWRNQAHGPKMTLRKLLWIEPVLIGE